MQRWNIGSYLEYLDRVIAYGTTSNGIFGVKIHAVSLAQIESSLGEAGIKSQDANIDYILGRLPPIKFISLRRHDKVRQAISKWKAGHTNFYTHRAGTDVPRYTLDFDRRAIDTQIRSFNSQDEQWSHFFQTRGIRPLQLSYEQDLEQNWKSTTLRVLRFLGLNPPRDLEITTDLQKQSNEHTEAMCALYHAGT